MMAGSVGSDCAVVVMVVLLAWVDGTCGHHRSSTRPSGRGLVGGVKGARVICGRSVGMTGCGRVIDDGGTGRSGWWVAQVSVADSSALVVARMRSSSSRG